jgi:hypothetical protein
MRLLASSFAIFLRKAFAGDKVVGNPSTRSVRAFDERIKFEEGLSDVDGAKTINIVATCVGITVLPIRRYKRESLLAWLEKRREFDIKFKQASFIDNLLGDGVILLRWR